MFVYKSRLLRRGEVWFDQEPEPGPVDWIYYRQRPSPVPVSRWKHFYTRLIDLAKSPAELRSEMDERTARKIWEAETRDHSRYEGCDPDRPGLMEEVESMWNRFAVAQRTPLLDRAWLDPIRAAGALDIGVVRDPAGEALVYQLSYLTSKRAQQLIAVARYLPTPTAAMRHTINRANCLGHWTNFLAFKARSIRYFDFGGWYPGATDIRLLGMNMFKKSFGGHVVREYECEQILTLKAWVILTASRWLDRTQTSALGQKRRSANSSHVSAKDCQVSPAFR